MIVPFNSWACPLDKLPMKRVGQSLICPQNHTFDFARAGYVHLLPTQFKKSRLPGDNKQMVNARRLFLNSGSYTPIRNAIIHIVQTYMTHQAMNPYFTFVDAACGEGYYTVGLADQLSIYLDKNISILGFDISREAILAATKRSKKQDWAVATNNRIPVRDISVDGLLSLFGFPVWSEFRRILKPNGFLVIADTDRQHLIEMRQQIYEHVFLKNNCLLNLPDGFISVDEIPVSYMLRDMSSQSMEALLKMTPHYYRMPAEKYESFIKNPPRNVTVDILLRILKRI